MKTFLTIFFLMLILILVSCGASESQKGHFLPNVISSHWLAGNLHNPNLVILHVGKKKVYDEGHIPGAVWVNLKSIHTKDVAKDISAEMPTLSKLNSFFSGLGISDSSTIVLYFGTEWVSATTRLYLTLDYVGLGNQTYLLDGGMNVWKSENYTVIKDITKIKPGNLNLVKANEIIVDKEWLISNLENSDLLIIDARSPAYYNGKRTVKNWKTRPGHIPNAKNILYSTLVDDSLYRFLDMDTLEDIFLKQGATKTKNIVTYCHLGKYASLVYFTAKNLGYQVKIYDGSFEEWGRDESLPLAVEDLPGKKNWKN